MRNRTVLQSSSEQALAISPESREHSVFVGGFPCQDISVAGKRTGRKGKRSGLYRDYLTIIASERPAWIITENVGHTWRKWVPHLRRSLHRLGYASLPLRVRASDMGAPHERSRIFIVAHPNGELLRELSRWWKGPGGQMATEFAKSWDTRSRRLGSDDGLSKAVDRRRALGNAIVPQIAQIIARGIKEISK